MASSTFVPLVPKNLAHPPVQWSAAEVKAWLNFCVEEFSLSPVCATRFDMNGKALCLLTRIDFMERAPQSGDVLHNVFQRLCQQEGQTTLSHQQVKTSVIVAPTVHSTHKPTASCRSAFVPILPQPTQASGCTNPTAVSVCSSSNNNNNSSNNNTTNNSNSNNNNNNSSSNDGNNVSNSNSGDSSISNTVSSTGQENMPCAVVDMLSPASLERSPSDSDSSCINDRLSPTTGDTMPLGDIKITADATCPSPTEEDGVTSGGESGCRLLWEFIYQLLQDDACYRTVVCWENQSELTFRINDQAMLADLWGQQKNKGNMTYEKLSRALRYYYKMNIVHKVRGRRLTYKFLQHPTKIRKGQRGARPHASRLLAQQAASAATTMKEQSDGFYSPATVDSNNPLPTDVSSLPPAKPAFSHATLPSSTALSLSRLPPASISNNASAREASPLSNTSLASSCRSTDLMATHSKHIKLTSPVPSTREALGLRCMEANSDNVPAKVEDIAEEISPYQETTYMQGERCVYAHRLHSSSPHLIEPDTLLVSKSMEGKAAEDAEDPLWASKSHIHYRARSPLRNSERLHEQHLIYGDEQKRRSLSTERRAGSDPDCHSQSNFLGLESPELPRLHQEFSLEADTEWQKNSFLGYHGEREPFTKYHQRRSPYLRKSSRGSNDALGCSSPTYLVECKPCDRLSIPAPRPLIPDTKRDCSVPPLSSDVKKSPCGQQQDDRLARDQYPSSDSPDNHPHCFTTHQSLHNSTTHVEAAAKRKSCAVSPREERYSPIPNVGHAFVPIPVRQRNPLHLHIYEPPQPAHSVDSKTYPSLLYNYRPAHIKQARSSVSPRHTSTPLPPMSTRPASQPVYRPSESAGLHQHQRVSSDPQLQCITAAHSANAYQSITHHLATRRLSHDCKSGFEPMSFNDCTHITCDPSDQVMDLSKPKALKFEDVDPEQEEPEDLSMKPLQT